MPVVVYSIHANRLSLREVVVFLAVVMMMTQTSPPRKSDGRLYFPGRVFSRAEPRHKQDIVRLLKEQGEVPADFPFSELPSMGPAVATTTTTRTTDSAAAEGGQPSGRTNERCCWC